MVTLVVMPQDGPLALSNDLLERRHVLDQVATLLDQGGRLWRMLAGRRNAASERTGDNVETTVCSADGLPFGDSTFDSVSVRFG